MRHLAKMMGLLASATLVMTAVPSAATAEPASATAPSQASAALPSVSYSGTAYGTAASLLDNIVTSGRTALSLVTCTTEAGKHVTNDVAGVDLGVLGKVGAVTTQSRTIETTTKRNYTQARVAGVNLLGGRITADAVAASSSAMAGEGNTRSGANSFSLVNLKIAGQPISADVGKNTKVTIPGVAEVTVNKQVRVTNAEGRYAVQTIGLAVRLLPGNPLGLPTSSYLNVAYATSALDPVRGENMHNGLGFSSKVVIAGGAVKSSPTASASPPCTGGTASNDLARINIPLLVDTGTTTTTATGSSTSSGQTTRVVNRTASPRLLGGLISADALVADTSVTTSGGRTTFADRSSFLGLKIAGRRITDAELGPNSTIQIPGIAKVTVHQQHKSGRTITVSMLRIELLTATAGQPAGAVIYVGYSRSALF